MKYKPQIHRLFQFSVLRIRTHYKADPNPCVLFKHNLNPDSEEGGGGGGLKYYFLFWDLFSCCFDEDYASLILVKFFKLFYNLIVKITW